jgi:CHASE3 domain sensor protein
MFDIQHRYFTRITIVKRSIQNKRKFTRNHHMADLQHDLCHLKEKDQQKKDHLHRLVQQNRAKLALSNQTVTTNH